jgi:hypothetical protein
MPPFCTTFPRSIFPRRNRLDGAGTASAVGKLCPLGVDVAERLGRANGLGRAESAGQANEGDGIA